MELSTRKWIVDLIKEKVIDPWPESVKKLAGTWKDFPLVEEIRETVSKDNL